MDNIPKIIHYCWFGNKKKPKLVNKCMKTWEKELHDYKIIEWNENNFNINNSKFALSAYKNKKWAFVADYCRIWQLYNYGGIYLDTDVEVVRNMDDLLNNNAFVGMEDSINMNAAIIGSMKGNLFLKKILDYYDKLDFEKYKDNLFEIMIPTIITKLAQEEGWKRSENVCEIKQMLTIYPEEYFYPKRHSWEVANITKNTYTIHHYEGTWRSKRKIYRTKFKEIIVRIFGHEKVDKWIKIMKIS